VTKICSREKLIWGGIVIPYFVRHLSRYSCYATYVTEHMLFVKTIFVDELKSCTGCGAKSLCIKAFQIRNHYFVDIPNFAVMVSGRRNPASAPVKFQEFEPEQESRNSCLPAIPVVAF
jgi:hypothetical protein